MEPRNYLADAVDNPPEPPESPSSGFPTDGKPLGGQEATIPGAWWIYKVGESLRRVIVAAGLTPSDENLDLLKDAIFSAATSKASQAEVNAGEDDDKFVTPKKLRWGFSVLLEANGYIVFPTWFSSIIIQWGETASIGANGGSSGTINFLVPFPTKAAYVSMIGTAPVTTGTNTNLTLATKTNSSFSFINSYLSAVGFNWIAVGY